jgi:hypothetical protein
MPTLPLKILKLPFLYFVNIYIVTPHIVYVKLVIK